MLYFGLYKCCLSNITGYMNVANLILQAISMLSMEHYKLNKCCQGNSACRCIALAAIVMTISHVKTVEPIGRMGGYQFNSSSNVH